MASSSQAKGCNKFSVEKFCSITGVDESVAKNLLEICNGNLEMAINMHWDCEAQTDTGQNVSRSSTSNDNDDDVRPPIPPTRGVLVDTLPFGLRGRQSPRSIFDGFRDFRAEAIWQEENFSATESKASRKRKTLEDLFRPPLDLMHRGSLESARELGRTSIRWLMVNIQNVQEFACQVLNRDVWSNPAVKSIISEHFIFWQVYCESEEGQRYIQFYNVTDYPYVAILDPRTGEKLVVWNNIDSVSFCDLAIDFLSHHPSPGGSNLNKKTKVENILDKSEEQQMKAAIELSLSETAAKLSNKTLENMSDDDTDIETFESDSEISPLNSHHSQNSVHIKENENHLKNNNNNNNDNADCDHKKSSNWKIFIGNDKDPKSELIIRFPDGSRQHTTFPCSSQLQALLLYIVSLGYPNDKYELVTNFPRRQLSSLKEEQTLKEVGLFPRETVFIQRKSD